MPESKSHAETLWAAVPERREEATRRGYRNTTYGNHKRTKG